MPRKLRSELAGPVHHVVNRGNRRQSIYVDDKDRGAFVGILGDALQEFNASCVALCLMGNHYHLVLRCEVSTASEVMHELGGEYTNRYNVRHGVDGSLFKGRFFSKPIQTDQYLRACIRYVHLNPHSIGPAVDLDRYRWSTNRHYLGWSRPAPWMDLGHGLSVFDNDVATYRHFMEQNKTLCEPVAIQEILQRSVDQLTAKRLTVLISREIGWAEIELVAPERLLGIGSAPSVRRLRAQARQLLDSRPDLAEVVDDCWDTLGLLPALDLPPWIDAP